MLIEILCTGDEILTGKTVNTNYSHMASRLNEVSLKMHWGTIVGDSREDLREAFEQASKRADIVIVNGGLGPTVDDLSQEIAAEAAGVKLKLNPAWLDRMLTFYERRGRTMPPNNKKQALLPEGAEFIDNPIGTACGFAIDIGDASFFFTPGVPRDMKRMLDEQIIPRLLQMSGVKKLTTLKRFHSFGIGESRADQMLNDIETDKNKEFVKLGFQAHYPQLETKIVIQAEDKSETEEILQPIIETVRERFGNFIIAEDNATFNKNVEAWKNVVSGFSSEDPEKVMSIFADSLKWNNPEALMNVNKSKEDLTAAVNFYISTFDNIKFTEDVYYGGSLYSTEEASVSPNGLRIYGNWVFNDPETGVEVSYKWMGVAQFNEDGKVHNFADWFDVSSIPSQIAGTYQR